MADTTTSIKLEQPLDYTRIVFNKIEDTMKSKTNQEYFEHVERFSDLLFPYYDEEFNKELSLKKLLPDLSNPFFQQTTPEKQKDYARNLFRLLIKLIHRSGFLPHKEVEGIITEEDFKDDGTDVQKD